MDIYEKILRAVYFTIIIWNKKNDQYVCKFSNEKDIYIKQDTPLNKYLEDHSYLKNLYQKLFDTKEEQNIIINNQHIVLYYLNEDIYYEIRSVSKEVFNYNHLTYINSQIREPLTTIMGAISTLYDLPSTKQQKQQYDQIEKANYELISLTNDIVDIINLGQNHIKLNLEQCDLKKMYY
ncbi:MAG: putative sensor histidine kinase [Edafosvirus sp.]|uniref:Putative sensor histidine kinase n=1 Tax=Edafosvirus sp. TaxID=2487765 RepID=A0A3G4ZZE4_9VIRU|nr:MAG: putative sensor histidine kinase [Edafosvirus sp.]